MSKKQKNFQGWSEAKSEWITIPRQEGLFDKVVEAGIPIRVLHPNGSYFVTHNQDKALELGLELRFANRETKASPPKSKSKTSKKSKTNVSTDYQVDADGFLIGSWNPA